MNKIVIESISCSNCRHSVKGESCNEGKKGVVAPKGIIKDDMGKLTHLVVHNQEGETVQVSATANTSDSACLVHEDGTVVRYRTT